MNKSEFLIALRTSLQDEVESSIIDQNIDYYDEYIRNSKDAKEEDIIDELGDPRLIAKTIIETDRISKEKDNQQGNPFSSYKSSAYEEDNGVTQDKSEKGYVIHGFKWYHKLLLLGILILVLLLIIIIGRVFIGIIYTFALPLLLVAGLLFIFKNRS